jgi:hypothetical protein
MSVQIRRLVVAVISIGAIVPTSLAAGHAVTRQHSRQYTKAYRAVARKDGKRAPGRYILGDGIRAKNGVRAPTDAEVVKSLGVLESMLAPPPAPAAPQATSTSTASAPAPVAASSSSGGGYSSVPGVPAGFAACVATRESSNGAGSSNIYGIIPASGHDVSGMSVAQQKQVFSQLYASNGTSPWSPYDGC